jgi:hypothetical protein
MVQLQRREVALSIVPMRSYRARRSNIAAAMETLGMRLIGRWMAKFQSQVGIRLTSNNRRTEIDLLTSGIRYSKMTAQRTGTPGVVGGTDQAAWPKTRLARVCTATTSTAMADIRTTHRPASTTNIFGDNRGSAILGTSNHLRLAAAPTFAIMALLTGVIGSPKDLLCPAAHDVSPLTGMAAMYLLMSIFHSPPWLKLISSRRKTAPARPVLRMTAVCSGRSYNNGLPRRSTASMQPER